MASKAFVAIFCNAFGEVQDMGIDTVRMIVSVTAVRTRAFDQVDSVAQVDDFLLLFDFAQQRGFEVDKSHIENKLRFV